MSAWSKKRPPACTWRGEFSNVEIRRAAEAFGTRLYDESEWNWIEQCERYGPRVGRACRDESRFVGFVNVLWDGLVHAYLEDVMVAAEARNRGVGVGLVAARGWRQSCGCEFLHASTRAGCASSACGFAPTLGGLMELTA